MNLILIETMPPWDWPPGTGAMLAKIMRNPQSPPADRILAANLASNPVVCDEPMAELFLSLVQDQSEPDELRAAAAISLGPILEETDIEGFDEDLSEPPISRGTFELIGNIFRQLHHSRDTPKLVRRRILEAAVRGTADWHQGAIRTAYDSGDEEWLLTAVFCMQYVRGFDAEILKMLETRNPEVHQAAVVAAGRWGLSAAWTHVRSLLRSDTAKPLLLVAMGAAACIAPQKALELLQNLAESHDEDIAEAANEALFEARLENGSIEDSFVEDEDDDDPYEGQRYLQ